MRQFTTPFSGPRQRLSSDDSVSSGHSNGGTESSESSGMQIIEDESSHTRALKLQTLYELSSDKDWSLNKNADFRRGAYAPMPGKTVLSKETVATFQRREQLLCDHHKSDGSNQMKFRVTTPYGNASARSKCRDVTPPRSESAPATSSPLTSVASLETTISTSRSMDNPECDDHYWEIRRAGSDDLDVARRATIRLGTANGPRQQERTLIGVDGCALRLQNEAWKQAIVRSNRGPAHRRRVKRSRHPDMTLQIKKFAGSSSTFDELGRPQTYTMDYEDCDDSDILSSRHAGSSGLTEQDKEAFYRVKALEDSLDKADRFRHGRLPFRIPPQNSVPWDYQTSNELLCDLPALC